MADAKEHRDESVADKHDVRGDATISFEGGSTNSAARRSATLQLNGRFGRYQILKELGHGGMGTVYLAFDTVLERKVALKIPRFQVDQDEVFFERFRREARAAAAIHHPSICSIYDVGELDGIHFISMAYIEGKPLGDFVKRSRPHPEKNVALAIRKLALALEEAHKAGVVHRDLKPNNVMVCHNGELIVMDFGLARQELLGTGQVELTQSGEVLGTPAYMSPEQVLGDTKSVGAASDIYSLGVIMYELLTGSRPFEGRVGELLVRIATETPVAPAQVRDGLHPELSRMCLKALAKRPEDRFHTMAEFAASLTTYFNEVHLAPPSALPVSSSALPQIDVSSPDSASPVHEPEARRPGKLMIRGNKRMQLVALSGVVVAILISAALLWSKFSGREAPTVASDDSKRPSASSQETNAKDAANTPSSALIPNTGQATPLVADQDDESKESHASGSRANDPPGTLEPLNIETSADGAQNAGVNAGTAEPVRTADDKGPADGPTTSPATPSVPAAVTTDSWVNELARQVFEPKQQAPLKSPAPNEQAQSKAKALVEKIFAEPSERAQSPVEQHSLSAKMMLEASKIDAQDATCYVLLRMALAAAIKAGDFEQTLKAVDELASRYEVDKYEEMAAAIKEVAPILPKDAISKATEGTLEISRESLAAKRFAAAETLVLAALQMQRREPDVALRAAANNLRKRIRGLQQLEDAYDEATAAASRDSNDAEAHLTVGKVLCFSREDWDEGLKFLVKGSDKQMRELAELDLSAQSATGDTELAIRVANEWWDWAAKSPDEYYYQPTRERARFWYESVRPTANQLVGKHIDERLKSLDEPEVPAQVHDNEKPTGAGNARGKRRRDAVEYLGRGRDSSSYYEGETTFPSSTRPHNRHIRILCVDAARDIPKCIKSHAKCWISSHTGPTIRRRIKADGGFGLGAQPPDMGDSHWGCVGNDGERAADDGGRLRAS